MSKLAVKALKWGKTLLVGEKQLVGDKAVELHAGLIRHAVRNPVKAVAAGAVGYHFVTGATLPEMAGSAWREFIVGAKYKGESLAVGTAKTLVDTTFGEGTAYKLSDKAQQLVESGTERISQVAQGTTQMAGMGAEMAGSMAGGVFSEIGSLVRGVMSHGKLLSVAALIPLAYMFFGNHGLMGKLAGLVLAPVIFNSMNLGSILDSSSPKAAPAISAQETGQLLSRNYEQIVAEDDTASIHRSRR